MDLYSIKYFTLKENDKMKKASLLILVSMILLLAFSSCTLVFKDKLPEPEEVLHSHVYGDVWESDALYHFKGCECGEKSNYTYHSDENGDRLCDACSYELPAQLATLLVTVEAD